MTVTTPLQEAEMVAPSLLDQELMTRPTDPSSVAHERRPSRFGRVLRRRRSVAASETAAPDVAFTIRRATQADRGALAELASLDSGRAPEGPALVAELDGRVVAALDLRSQRAIADPFRPSAEAVELLRLRAAQLKSPADPPGGPRRAYPVAPPRVAGAPHH